MSGKRLSMNKFNEIVRGNHNDYKLLINHWMSNYKHRTEIYC